MKDLQNKAETTVAKFLQSEYPGVGFTVASEIRHDNPNGKDTLAIQVYDLYLSTKTRGAIYDMVKDLTDMNVWIR